MHANDAFRRFRKRFQAEKIPNDSTTPIGNSDTPRKLTTPSCVGSQTNRTTSGSDEPPNRGDDPLLRSFVADQLSNSTNHTERDPKSKALAPVVRISKRKKRRRRAQQAPMAVADPLGATASGRHGFRKRTLTTAIHMLKGKASKPLLPTVCIDGNEGGIKNALQGNNEYLKVHQATNAEEVGWMESISRPPARCALPKNVQSKTMAQSIKSSSKATRIKNKGLCFQESEGQEPCHSKKLGKRRGGSLKGTSSPAGRIKKSKEEIDRSCMESEGKSGNNQPRDFRNHFVELKARFQSVVSQEFGIKIGDLGKGAKESLMGALLKKVDGGGSSENVVQDDFEGACQNEKSGDLTPIELSVQGSVSSVNIPSTGGAHAKEESLVGVSRKLDFEGLDYHDDGGGLVKDSPRLKTGLRVANRDELGNCFSHRSAITNYCKASIAQVPGCPFSQGHRMHEVVLGKHSNRVSGPPLSDGESKNHEKGNTSGLFESTTFGPEYDDPESPLHRGRDTFLDWLSPSPPGGGNPVDGVLILDVDTGSPQHVADLIEMRSDRTIDWLEGDESPFVFSPRAEFQRRDFEDRTLFDFPTVLWDNSGSSVCLSDWASEADSDELPQLDAVGSITIPKQDNLGSDTVNSSPPSTSSPGGSAPRVERYSKLCDDSAVSEKLCKRLSLQATIEPSGKTTIETLDQETNHMHLAQIPLAEGWEVCLPLGVSGSCGHAHDAMDIDEGNLGNPAIGCGISHNEVSGGFQNSCGTGESEFIILDRIWNGSSEF